MAYQLSRREVEDLRSSLDRAIYRTIGKSDSSLLSTVSSCLTNGYERRKIIDKISSHIDSKKASKLADKVIALAQELVSTSKTQKRKYDDKDKDKDSKRSRHDDRHESRDEKRDRDRDKDREDKEKKADNGMELPSILPDGETIGSKMAGLSADKIKVMMANAQKEIEERKRALLALKGEPGGRNVSTAAAAAQQLKVQMQQNNAIPPPSVIKPVLYSKPGESAAQPITAEELEKQRKIAELQARIQRKLAGGALAAAGASGPAPLILDREGRTIDTSGKRVQLTHVAPTLKANIRAKRREEFRAQLSASGGDADDGARWHDARVRARAPARAKRALRFHEPGKFTQLAERLRMKAQLEKLQNEISQIARKTGISSATKLALLAADVPDYDRVPDIEWWDSVILMTPEEREAKRQRSAAGDGRSGSQRVEACNLGADDIVDNVNEDAITNLVEHPQQLRPPTEPLKPTYMPVFLTKKERKKLRRQSRREAWKEEQEKVRLGLEAPPEPKLRISNLMRALGTEAVQDPTAIEAKVREQIAKRQKTHLDANRARALTRDQKREKIDRKIREDTSMSVHVAVYRVKDLFECASAKFKVEVNAQQLHMTGCVLLHRGCCVVVVEGGPRQHAKYKRLMLHRIKWEEEMVKDADGQPTGNSCHLVWEGATAKRAFGDIKFKVMPTEKQARELFSKHGVEHYWDLAYSGAVLGAGAEEP
ncbi:U4/U6 small nuclear ribonucleoprotein Prp3 [Vanessa cardui]|uniref:U4/U6 small nuclear ribonucleoprotein Prp3 n=1 Tax=Vanessa cardui TaxID=171605 RepID=UPI001F14343C|nr:U4/U6 small nuclear ribonucleoprotein Prp3 [Vanessa cardui]